MNSKLIGYFLIAFLGMIAWNVFLIHRDNQMFNVYDQKAQKIKLGNPPSNSVKNWCEMQGKGNSSATC